MCKPPSLLGTAQRLIFLTFCLCCFGFHFGNAAMLPLLGQKLSLGAPGPATCDGQGSGAGSHAGGSQSMLFMASCQVVAQGIMTVVAAIVGRLADTVGRQPIFLVGFAIIPTRGFVVSLIPHSSHWMLIATQCFDGLANGIFDLSVEV